MKHLVTAGTPLHRTSQCSTGYSAPVGRSEYNPAMYIKSIALILIISFISSIQEQALDYAQHIYICRPTISTLPRITDELNLQRSIRGVRNSTRLI